MVRAKGKFDKKPKIKRKKLIFKNTLRKIKNKNRIKDNIKIFNPRITSFTSQSHFIYDIDAYQSYFNSVKNRNLLKLNDEELIFLTNKINDLSNLKIDSCNSSYISINKSIYDKINLFNDFNTKDDELTLYIKNLFETNINRDCISCRKISSKYFNDTGKKVSKSKVHNILKNKLNLRYLKTTIKTNRIKENSNILISLCFIKIIIKCLKMDYKLIFVDESKIQQNNNNYRTWRRQDETIYYSIENRSSKNLIAAVGENNVIYYEINDENTNENIFLNFMKNLKLNIDKMKIDRYVVILDNFSGHKTSLLLRYYQEEKINILFNSPYQSIFNCIELFFRLIKQKIYNKLYKSVDEVITEMVNIICDENIKSSLLQNYRETLEQYYKFSVDHKNLNLNNFEF